MKKIFYIIPLTLAMAAAISCEWKEYEEPEETAEKAANGIVSLVNPDLLFGPDGGTNVLEVVAPGRVDVSSEASWLSFVVETDSIRVTAQPNGSISSRYAPVKIKYGEQSVTVTVQQSGVVVKDFSPADITVTSKGGSFQIPFEANTTMQVSSDQSFVVPTVATDEEDATYINIEVAKNPTVDARTAVVTYALGDRTGTITVSQAGAMVQNTNWTISYEGVTKVDGWSNDDVLVTVGSDDTGYYAVVVVPKSEFTASKEEQEDFVITGVLPKADKTSLKNATEHFYYRPKFENDTYIAYAVGINDDGTSSGYYQYYEFTINRTKTPYEKLLGSWNIDRQGNTDIWVIEALAEDESFVVSGIEGHGADFWDGPNPVAQFDAATGALVLKEQTITSLANGDETVVVQLVAYVDVSGEQYYWGGGSEIFRVLPDASGNTATITPNIMNNRYPVTGMVFYGFVNGSVSYWWCGGTYQTFPASLTKTTTASTSSAATIRASRVSPDTKSSTTAQQFVK